MHMEEFKVLTCFFSYGNHKSKQKNENNFLKTNKQSKDLESELSLNSAFQT